VVGEPSGEGGLGTGEVDPIVDAIADGGGQVPAVGLQTETVV